jgi:inosine/xanthosine triphosphatase
MNQRINIKMNSNMYLFVGSTNPVKTNAVTVAASETWSDCTVLGFETKSGVSEQPRTDEETRTGAQNRARAALESGLEKIPVYEAKESLTHLGIGLEGGVTELADGMYSTVWVCVVDSQGTMTEANGARFKVPEKIANLIREGKEMGPIVAQLSGEKDVRSKQGMIGIITNGFVDRTEEYTGITKMALGLWYGREIANVLR